MQKPCADTYMSIKQLTRCGQRLQCQHLYRFRERLQTKKMKPTEMHLNEHEICICGTYKEKKTKKGVQKKTFINDRQVN